MRSGSCCSRDYTPWPSREKFYADALDDILTAAAHSRAKRQAAEDF